MSTTISSFFRHATRTLTSTSSITTSASTKTSYINVSWTKPSQFQSLQRRYAHNGDLSGYNSRITAILGAQWGDEGKGKMIDILAKRYDIVGRFNGGANAGHTLVVNKKKFAFHLLPCGMLYDNKINVIGNGVVLDIPIMMKELESLDKAGIDWKGRLLISNRAQLLFDVHKLIDGQQEKTLAENNIGTTKKGIGPCYASKATRNGIRVGELIEWDGFEARHRTLIESLQRQYHFEYNITEELERYRKYRDFIAPMVTDTVHYLNTQHSLGKTILAEGANAALLDIDHGTYPYVTSSATTVGGISTGLGIAATKLDCTIGVVKAYTTRVGSGPFPTELNDTTGEHLRKLGGEFGTTTGRPRRCGWLDIPVIQYSHMLNNYNSINITKLDVLSETKEIKIGIAYTINGKRLPYGYMPSTLKELSQVQVEYESHPGWMCDISQAKTVEELPTNAQKYLKRVEELVKVPISWVGVGAGRDQMATAGFKAL